MKYTINFSLKLKKEGSYIVYDTEKFAEKPIEISVPDVVKILESFIKSFEQVGILEQASPKSIQSQEKEKNGTDTPGDRQLSEQKPITTSTDLKGLSGKAYICKSKELDETVLNQFCTELTEYIKMCCLNFSPENLLSEQNGLYVSGLREVLELRNYLARYTRSNKKNYQNGYLYIMAV